MNMKLKLILASLFTALLLSQVAMVSAAPASDAELQKQVNKVLERFDAKGAKFTINDSSASGLREVVLGNEVFFLTEDGKYIVLGNVLSIDEGMRNLAEQTLGKIRRPVLDTINDDEMIIYGKKDAIHTLTVFTDINCTFCQLFHKKMDEMTAAGIRVKYIFLPVITPNSYEDAKSVWCAADRNKALTEAKAGKKLATATCDTPIDKHMEVGRELGISSTPTIFLDDGSKSSLNWTKMTGAQIAAALDEINK
jgi:thiol:disulfide interchange protein DsbC